MVEIFEMIGQGGAAFASALGEIFTAVSSIFWVPGAEGSLGNPTFIGTLTIAGVVGSLAMFGIKFIQGLFKGTAKK